MSNAKSILPEKDFQQEFVDKLLANGYEELTNSDYDRLHALCPSALIRFLDKTQPDTMAALRKAHKEDTNDIIVNFINTAETSKNGSRLDLLKHGIYIGPHHLDLMYDKPASELNQNLVRLYKENIFTVIPEVWASNDERIDVVLFLNGIAIMAFELKNGVSQSCNDGIAQFRNDRNPKTRLFLWKSGVLVSFAMDPFLVAMTTRLAKEKTMFLPFNQGAGEGVEAGAGNPVGNIDGEYGVHYMWDNILKKDSVLEIIRRFMFVERKEEIDSVTGKTKVKENVIFPRYHQLDVVRKLLADVKENHTASNYLIQHSAGSGKTNEIAWLSYRLSELYDSDNKIIFDSVLICTDRIIVDRQLQEAITMLEHSEGKIKVMDSSCTSSDLQKALERNTKIIVTTIQKFPYIVDTVAALNNKKFAVIIDEAHSSTAGKNMDAVISALANNGENGDGSVDDMIEVKLRKSGKPKNVSMFAFTATPKATTLRIFGTPNVEGQYQAFHIYSMKQAIEEGFILDVLQNYTTYDTYYSLNKKIEEDPELNTSEAKRQIARFIQLHETNISQRVEIIIEHFRTTVMKELNGSAKAMVVTESRESAVRYTQAFEKYIVEHGYKDIHALVAFSGKLKVDDVEYCESGMNGFPESRTRNEFDTDNYQVLIVADKYQTGFDQKKLCAMYILKKLHGVSVVQTLSRLNRICPPYDKKTFILDFANEYQDILDAFAPYYTCTTLTNNPLGDCRKLYNRIIGYYIFYENDVEDFVELLFDENKNDLKTKKLTGMLQKVIRAINDKGKTDKDMPKKIKMSIRSYIRCYEFLQLVTCLKEARYYKMYIFLCNLKGMLESDEPGPGFNLTDKLKAEGFIQKKKETVEKPVIISDPEVKLTNADKVNFSEEKKKRLSEIIKEINSRTGMTFDEETAYAAILQVKEFLKKNPNLRRSAVTNPLKDFEAPYYDEVDGALYEGYEQNKEFYKLLMKNEEMKREFMDLFMSDVYESCKTPRDDSNPLS